MDSVSRVTLARQIGVMVESVRVRAGGKMIPELDAELRRMSAMRTMLEGEITHTVRQESRGIDSELAVAKQEGELAQLHSNATRVFAEVISNPEFGGAENDMTKCVADLAGISSYMAFAQAEIAKCKQKVADIMAAAGADADEWRQLQDSAIQRLENERSRAESAKRMYDKKVTELNHLFEISGTELSHLVEMREIIRGMQAVASSGVGTLPTRRP